MGAIKGADVVIRQNVTRYLLNNGENYLIFFPYYVESVNHFLYYIKASASEV